jgi:hypothetical protein
VLLRHFEQQLIRQPLLSRHTAAGLPAKGWSLNAATR